MKALRHAAFLCAVFIVLTATNTASADTVYVTLKQSTTGQYLTSLDKPLGCCTTGQAVAVESISQVNLGLPQYFALEGDLCTNNAQILIKSAYKNAYLESEGGPGTTYFQSGQNAPNRNYLVSHGGCLNQGGQVQLYHESQTAGAVGILGYLENWIVEPVEASMVTLTGGPNSSSTSICQIQIFRCSAHGVRTAGVIDGIGTGEVKSVVSVPTDDGTCAPSDTTTVSINVGCGDSMEISAVQWDVPAHGQSSNFNGDGAGSISFWIRDNIRHSNIGGSGNCQAHTFYGPGAGQNVTDACTAEFQ